MINPLIPYTKIEDVVLYDVSNGEMRHRKMDELLIVHNVIPIPTPRIWAKNTKNQLTSGYDINQVTGSWEVPEIYAQHFSPEDSAWKTYNPVYELVIHKLVRKGSGSPLRGYKWVHPVNNNANNTVKKYAGGRTWDQSTSSAWTNRQTEWGTDISTKASLLKGLDPHKYMSINGQTLANAGSDPFVGAIPEGSFLRKTYFTPRSGNKTKHKMAFAVRIRIDNPNFKVGVPNQEPYFYGDVSNVLVFRPKMYNLWDGTTVDFAGNNVLSHYFFDWVATEENSAQN